MQCKTSFLSALKRRAFFGNYFTARKRVTDGETAECLWYTVYTDMYKINSGVKFMLNDNKANSKVNAKTVMRIGGAFIAWVIGAGFATGQEALQFFSSYGLYSFAVAAVNLAGFIAVGYFLLREGFRKKGEKEFNHFKYFCGKKLGAFYTFLITLTLLLLIPVLFSGAGATLYEYYGVNRYIGSAVIAAAVLAVYLMGFEKQIKIISSIGPVIILFSLLVGIVTVLRDGARLNSAALYADSLAPYRAAPNWFLSAISYLGLNLFPGSTYFVRLGTAAKNEKEVKYGVLCGVLMVMLSVTVMSTAILLNGDAAAGLDIPVLYLAGKISYIFGAVFSVMLILGIFSSCTVMMWSVCSRFKPENKRLNAAFAAAAAVACYIISLFPFGSLINAFYPAVGYIGLLFIGCVIYKGCKKA